MSRRRVTRYDRVLNALTFLVLLFASALVLSPIAWTFVTSLKTPADIGRFPPRWIPDPITFHHYTRLLTSPRFWMYVTNTFIVAVGTILLCLVVALPAGYIASRYKFRGKNVILFLLLFTSMMPGIATIPALFILSIGVGLYDTFAVLVLVFAAWRAPTSMWLLRGFISTIPRELEEHAVIDGCTRFGAFFRIVLPLLKPGIAAVSVLVFVFVWNTWVFATTLITSPSKSVITEGLYSHITDLGVAWGGFTAYSILAILPVIAVFLSMQRFFIAGLATGAQK